MREADNNALAQALRDAGKDRIVIGTYYAPTFMLEKRENHDGMGYHCHVRILKNGGYERTGYLATMKDGFIYITRHGGEALFDLSRMSNALKRDIYDEAMRMLGRIPPKELLPTTSNSVVLG